MHTVGPTLLGFALAALLAAALWAGFSALFAILARKQRRRHLEMALAEIDRVAAAAWRASERGARP